MQCWTQVSRCFVETQTSHCVEMWPSRLESEKRASRSEIDRTRASRFGAGRTWVLRLTWSSHCWWTQDSRFGIEARSSHCLKETYTGMNLAFWICRADCSWTILNLLLTSTKPSSTFRIGNPRQPGTAEFGEERDGIIDLYRHFDCVSMLSPYGSPQRHWSGQHGLHERFQNLSWSDTACAVGSGVCHFRSNLQRDSWASLRRDFAVLPHCLGAGGAGGKEFLKLLLVEFNDEEFYRLPEKPDISLRYGILVSRERSPQRSRHFLFVSGKLGRCKFLWVTEKLEWNNSDYKEG